METLKTVIVTLQVEAFHCWPEAKDILPEVAFLSDRHRHIFYFKAYKDVEHNDRDVEIILLKRKMMTHLHNKYGVPCEFGRQSCEDLAEEMCREFQLTACEILEDNENGAVVQVVPQ